MIEAVPGDSEKLFDEAVNLFNDCEFFECHEVFEEIWTPSKQPERWFLQSLIHFAVGFHHHRRGNQVGATRQLRKGLKKIDAYLPEWGGVATERITRNVRDCLAIIEAGGEIGSFPKIEQTSPYRPGTASEGDV